MDKGQPAGADRTSDEAPHIVGLVERAQAGDRGAFHQLVDRFQPEIFRTLYYRIHSRMESEDLTQDVFLSAYKNLPRLKSPRLFRSWLYRIAVNRARDYYRRKRLRMLLGFGSIDAEEFRESEAVEAPAQAARTLDREAFWKHVRDMMGAMSGQEKEVFYLRFFDELSIKEITSVLGKSESTVKTHLYRALSKVKSAVARMDDWRDIL